MIQSLAVMNLPPNTRAEGGNNFSLKVGNEFRLDGKHLLLTGNNGVGKSTFLRALHHSFKRNQLFQAGGHIE
jgi:ABC-type uncharacterized transport system fused permease/ATPase subunit